MTSPALTTTGLTTKLRSRAWLAGDDEVALAHRVALASAGAPVAAGQPVIGIANSASQLNPCNLPLRDLVGPVKAGIEAAGGVGVEFPTISLGEDLMKPSAMLYRNLLAIEIEETIRANPLDGIVLLANCDKTVPGALMGAISANIPTVLVTGGSRPVVSFRGSPVGTGTSLWRLWDERRAGRLDDDGWQALERCLACGVGACNTMGTASTMAVLCEVLGFMVPGASTIPSGDPRSAGAARSAGEFAVRAVRGDRRPQQMLTEGSFRNAIVALNAAGGSTNAVIHLSALAGRTGVAFKIEDIASIGRSVPVLADVEPSGSHLMADFDAAGGVPTLLREVAPLLDLAAKTITGQPVAEVVAKAKAASGAIRPAGQPLRAGGAFAVVRGSLAPDGAVIKTSAATERLLRHRGPAVVFRGYDDMLARIDDPALPVTPDSVLVLTGCGPVGAGMPEWGMIPIPAKLLRAGVTDMVRVTDARMSGTSFGTVVLHVAPEAAIGGPLALVRDGDLITLDIPDLGQSDLRQSDLRQSDLRQSDLRKSDLRLSEIGKFDIEISEIEMSRRRAAFTPPPATHLRGWPALYAAHVTQAPQGCDLDFLRAPTAAHRSFIEPVVGRS